MEKISLTPHDAGLHHIYKYVTYPTEMCINVLNISVNMN